MKKINNKEENKSSKFAVFIHLVHDWCNHHRMITFFIDLTIVIGLVIVVLLENKGIVCYLSNHNLAVDVIVSLLPAIATIISISIQIQNEKIRGITIREFNRLRGGLYFTLLHMLLLIVAIFACETVFILSSMQFGLLVLDGVSLFYAFIFLVTEIPILIQKDRSINRVLKKYVLEPANYLPQQQNDYVICLTYSAVTYSYSYFFNKISFANKRKTEALLTNILNYHYGYFNEIFDRVGPDKQIPSLYDIDFFKAFGNSFEDIDYLLNEKNEPNISYLSKNNNGVFYLTRLTYILYFVANKTGYGSLFENNLKQLVNQFYLKVYGGKIEDYRFIYLYLLAMSISTLQKGEVWFVSALRDRTFAPLFFDVCDNPLTFLITMYMCFLKNSQTVENETNDAIDVFLNEQSKGINSDNYKWKEKIKNSLRNLNSGKYFLTGVTKILKLKNYLDDIQYEVIPKHGGIYTIDDSTHFGNELVLEYCLEILLFNHFHDVGEKEIEAFIQNLTANDKVALRHLIETKWSENNYNSVFYQFIFDKQPDSTFINVSILNVLKQKTFSANKKEYDDSNLKDEDLIKMKTKLNEKIEEIANKSYFIKKQEKIQNVRKQYFGLLVDGFDRISLFDKYLDQLPFSFNGLIRKELETITPTHLGGYTYDQKTIDTIIKFGPTYYSNSYRMDFNATNKQKEKISKFIEVDDGSIPLDMFLKKNALNVKFVYYEKNSQPRFLKRREIEEIIDRDYTMINGYYRFNKYKGSSIGNFFCYKRGIN